MSLLIADDLASVDQRSQKQSRTVSEESFEYDEFVMLNIYLLINSVSFVYRLMGCVLYSVSANKELLVWPTIYSQHSYQNPDSSKRKIVLDSIA